ncbi:MAG TPA: PIG-L deacetylase family protein [Bryobacteraceae bacterium]|jgi:LmbE family N-acetylglucosaminyl deacetylase
MTTRRQVLAGSLTLLAAAQTPAAKLNIVCTGGHPDDPESGCGGTLARFSGSGHKVTILYLTRGERGIQGKSLDEAASIRTAEAQAACRILGAKPVFAGQIDGATELNQERVAAFSKLLAAESPDIVFTQWPIDSHMDHQVASILTLRAWYGMQRRFRLYFYEVNAGAQTMGFHPTDYIDITSVRDKKKAALFAHKSQDGEEIYRKHHEVMENFRGREARMSAAEGFVHLAAAGSALDNRFG